ncbi:MAG TPA: EAL domain-containing protein [Gemmatimonadota bacterium]|nr:EAL domain-containing protein [Gemmatimonadota bacterium]
MGTPLRLLIVDDSEDDARLLERHLVRADFDVSSQRVDSRTDLVGALDRAEWDIVLGDFSMPGFSGLEALSVVRARSADLPFIIVSGTIGEESAVDAMRSGAADYVMKGHTARLVPVIERELREARSRRERRRAEERLRYLAHHDELTGLPNRTLFMDRLQQALLEADRRDDTVSILILDMDRFQVVNDTLGHATGDVLLQAVGRRLEAGLDPGQTLARLAGDEFAFLLWNIDTADGAARTAQAVLDSFSEPFTVAERELRAAASAGVAVYPDDASEPDSLLGSAYAALREAKRGGRHTFQFFTDAMTSQASRSLALEHDLRLALDGEAFDLHYQPLLSTESGRIVQLEALLRWTSPERGRVPPGEFIPLAEETGLIIPLGGWSLRAACEQAGRWRRDGVAVPVAVNVSVLQLRRGDLADQVRRALDEAGLSGPDLAIEVTESALMADPATAATTLERLRQLGVTISLDDFGTGYSSLSYLKDLPLDRVKIDRSFIRHVPDDPHDTALTAAIIAMGSRLGLSVVAEGVETERQADFLVDESCDLLQGYLLGRPEPASDATARLRAQAGPGPT